MTTKHSDNDADNDDAKSNRRQQHSNVDGGAVRPTDARRYSTERYADITLFIYTNAQVLYVLCILGIVFFLSNIYVVHYLSDRPATTT